MSRLRRRVSSALALVLVAAALPVLARNGCQTVEPEAGMDAGRGADRHARLEAEGSGGFERKERSALAGTVLDEEGRAVAGASVFVRGPRDAKTRSDEDGSFAFEGLEPGEYLAFASMGERASETLGPIPLANGEELRGLMLTLQEGVWLSGTIRGLPDGELIRGATLTAGPATSTSDERGGYRLQGLPSGKVIVAARAEGYVPRTSEVELPRKGGRGGADLHLERGARVYGHVRASGAPVAAIEVRAARYGAGARLSELTFVGFTDDQGGYAGWVPPGRLELVAKGGGWAEARTGELELLPGDEREIDLALGPGGAVFGAVRSGEGAPRPGCQVQAFDAAHGRSVAGSASGVGGEYWIAAVPQSVYVVVAACAEGRAEQSGVVVTDGAQVQLDLTLGSGALAGRVIDPTGQPVAGALVTVRREGSAADPTPIARTGADGRFEARGLAGERFELRATSGQAEAELAAVTAGSREILLILGSGVLRGIVVGDRGEPISDFTVYAEPAPPAQGWPRSQRFLAPSGEFEMVLSPGLYEVRAGAPGHGSASAQSVAISASETTSLRLSLSSGHEVVGKVVDEKGVPIAGARVATHPSMLWAFGRAAPVPAGSSALSDSQGAFRLTGVPAGDKVWLVAHKEGFRQQSRRISVPTEASGIVLVLALDDRPEKEKEFAGVGMSLAPREGRIFVIEAFEAGPARAAGIRRGDELLAVDGMPVAGVPFESVIASIRGLVGTTVELLIEREGRRTRVAVARASIKF